jgi:uncharacterized caspase-like protein
MHRLAGLLIAGLTVCFSSQTVLAEKRVALVIGNSAYKNVPRLANPANDAAAIAEMFRSAKFDVVEARRDLGIVEMRRALRDYSDKSRETDIAVIYFAGHGLEVEGVNYLVPVDAVLERDRDAFDEAIPLDRVLQSVESAKKLRLIILDACRDNPFSRTMKRSFASRTLERGLVNVEPTKSNTLIAFAAKGGSIAADGDGVNSPFTTSLLRYLGTPGLDLRKAFGLVRDDVMQATSNRQEPFVYGSLGGTDVSLVPGVDAASSQSSANQQAEVRRDYELALQLGTKDAWNSFLNQYSSGFYADLARGQLDKIASEEARRSATERARLAEADKARLIAEGATAAERARAEREAKAAEETRIAAERNKQTEQAKVEMAERVRAVAQRAAAEKLANEVAARETEAARKAAEDERKIKLAAVEQKKTAEAASANAANNKVSAGEQAADQKTAAGAPAQMAALPDDAGKATMRQQEIARSLQTELRRVGCLSSAGSDDWNAASRRSLELFNKHAALKLDVKVASLDALEAVRSKTARICPVICEDGYRVENERCVKIPSVRRERAEKPAIPKDRRASSARSGLPACSVYCKQKYGGAMPHYENICLAWKGNCDHSR